MVTWLCVSFARKIYDPRLIIWLWMSAIHVTHAFPFHTHTQPYILADFNNNKLSNAAHSNRPSLVAVFASVTGGSPAHSVMLHAIFAVADEKRSIFPPEMLVWHTNMVCLHWIAFGRIWRVHTHMVTDRATHVPSRLELRGGQGMPSSFWEISTSRFVHVSIATACCSLPALYGPWCNVGFFSVFIALTLNRSWIYTHRGWCVRLDSWVSILPGDWSGGSVFNVQESFCDNRYREMRWDVNKRAQKHRKSSVSYKIRSLIVII